MADQAPIDDLLAWDRAHLWHPYSSSTAPAPVHEVESACGVRLRMRRPATGSGSGQTVEVVDAMSSWWCAVNGYAVPELDAAAAEQLTKMSHVMFGGLTHRPAVELGRRLVDLVGLDHVFLADSGSVSVEVAMKMAWQSHAGDEGLTRRKFFTIRGGYHGDTFSPMSVCDPDGGMHSMYGGLVPEHVFAPRPPGGLDRADDAEVRAWEVETRSLFEQHAHEIAAVIVEPVLQGAGGMWIYPPRCLDFLARLAREHGALVIHDEIATGFWRTGPVLGGHHGQEQPDIVCVGKALTGGYLTLAAVLCTDDVAERVSRSPAGAMMHGPTFMGNPLACAVACSNLDLLEKNDAAGRVEAINAELVRGLSSATELDSVVAVRTIGAVGVIELEAPVDVVTVTEAALDRGVWVRPFRNLVYTMPPYVCTAEEIQLITGALVDAVAEVHG